MLDALKYVDFFGLLPAAARLPISMAYRIADWRAGCQRRMRPESSRHAEINMAQVFPVLGRSEIRQLVRRQFQTQSRDELEVWWYGHPLSFLEQLIDFTGLEELQSAARSGRGVLFFSSHSGSFGLCWTVLGKLGFPLNIVARSIEPEENPLHPAALRFNRMKVARIEQALKRPFILTGRGNYFRFRELLDSGEILMIVVDVLPMLVRRVVPVQFLGRSAYLPDGLASLYQDTQARLVHWAMSRDPVSGRHRVLIRDVTDQVDRSASKAEIIQSLADRVEVEIRAHPDQWHAWDSVSHYFQRPEGTIISQ